MLKAARDGYFLGGRVPFGYVIVADGKRKRRDADLLDAEAAAVIVERWLAAPQDATEIP